MVTAVRRRNTQFETRPGESEFVGRRGRTTQDRMVIPSSNATTDHRFRTEKIPSFTQDGFEPETLLQRLEPNNFGQKLDFYGYARVSITVFQV